MRSIIVAATAAVIFVAGTAASLADGSSSTASQCANILANPTGYPAGLAAYCGNADPAATPHFGGRVLKAEKQGNRKRQNPFAFRTAPMMQDDGPTIALPG
jgi:hypothetical protein